jgi:enolase
MTIRSVSAIEILDSRGRPTLLVTCKLADGTIGRASVPSGASTGSAEVLELRDNDMKRFAGYGCLKAVSHINNEMNLALAHKTFHSQAQLDQTLIELDGTHNKSRLGANAILGVSLAYSRAIAIQSKVELYQLFADIAHQQPCLPHLMVNLFSGGKHAGQQTAIQDVQLVIPQAPTIKRTLEIISDVYAMAARRAFERYGMRLLTADEGGLAPPFQSSTEMFAEAIASIEQAGYQPGVDAVLTVDIAASHFYKEGQYHLDGEVLDSDGMIKRLTEWCQTYPIISIEDGLADSDWGAWQQFNRQVGANRMILGDDLLCTNPTLIRKAIAEQSANSLLLKVNQIGTLTEALEAYQLARGANWKVVVSARSGETEDDWLADLATGIGGDYIKVGSITQSERLAKFNRLLVIEHETTLRLP